MPIILKENECVYCRTTDEFRRVCMTFENKRQKNIDTICKRWNKPTCVSIDAFTSKKNWGYSGINYYKDKMYKIISFYEFMEIDPIKTYTQSEVNAVIADTRKKTIDEIIERITGARISDNALHYYRCNICGKFKSKNGKCKSCGDK
jgi:hypothetical protein